MPAETTVARFTELLQEQGYSRVPVYEGSLDKIIGILLARDLLQVSDEEAQTKTVRDLMRPDVYFVPETKLGSELLRLSGREDYLNTTSALSAQSNERNKRPLIINIKGKKFDFYHKFFRKRNHSSSSEPKSN